MPEIIKFGPFLIKSSLLIILFATVVAYFVMKLKLKQTDYESSIQKKGLNIITDSIFVIVIFYKFGPFFTNPITSFKNFFVTLTITGSTVHLWLGAAIAVLFLFIQAKRKHIPFSLITGVLPFGLLTVSILYSLFVFDYGVPTSMPWGISITTKDVSYHPLHFYHAILSIGVFLYLWRKPLNSNRLVYHFLLSYGIGSMIISFFDYANVAFLSLSPQQWGFALMMIVGALHQIFRPIK
jgi:hypothetical protein